MKLTTFGDMAHGFSQTRANTDIRTHLNTLTNELSTGKVEDLTARLGGDSVLLRDIDRQLAVSRVQTQAVTEAAQWTATMQLQLERINVERGTLTEALLTLSSDPLPEQRALAAKAGENAFASTVAALNSRFAGEALFAGRATDATPLMAAGDMLTALRTAAAGATIAADVIATVDTWFDAPGGGFETTGYVGDDTGNLSRRLSDDLTVTPGIRADDQTLRNVLKATALAALAEDTSFALTGTARLDLLTEARDRALNLDVPLTEMRASLGYHEEQIERQQANLAARTTALSLTRNETVAADPYETAARLQEVQSQLELHYALTARMSQLTLANYLR